VDFLQVTVLSCVKDAQPQHLINHTVIVIDVLRATTNMITAMIHGCSGIVPLETIEDTRNLRKPYDLLGGERNCHKIPGFDFGNSPYEYMSPCVRGKRILMTTTNGTRVIQMAGQAKHIMAGALINARACALAAAQLQDNICILCSGRNDEFSLEDGLCAGLLIEELKHLSDAELTINDMGICLQNSYLQAKGKLEETILNCSTGKRLRQLGYEKDIAYCSTINITSIVPLLLNEMLVPYRSKNTCPS
jgi:2-phosphosulfolactate phosphatase